MFARQTLLLAGLMLVLGSIPIACRTTATTTGKARAPEMPTLTIKAAAQGTPLDPMFYGIFFEDINHAGDGGLYAELIRNRNFDDSQLPEGTTHDAGFAVTRNNYRLAFDASDPLPGWELVGEDMQGAMALDQSRPLNPSNPNALRLESTNTNPDRRVGAANDGYWGIALKKGAQYRLSLDARAKAGLQGPLEVTLEHPGGQVLAKSAFNGIGEEWKHYSAELTATSDTAHARLVLAIHGPGTLWLDMVSLFSADTFMGRPNGMRPDLAQMLADMRPGFLRFPGGCFVEGICLANALRWKTTVGDIAERPGRWNLWNYRSTDGLGYHEYLQLSEDLKAEPLLVVNCGMSCQVRRGEVVPLEEIQPWIDDALDAIEYANGRGDSKWGSMRARNGHPEPFGLKYIEIGNENAGADYEARYKLFYDAIKRRHPDMRIIIDTRIDNVPADIRDDHFYVNARWLRSQGQKYALNDPDTPKIYVGEYSDKTDSGQGNLRAALAEASFLIGLENSADNVIMTSYAPLFVNVHDRRWNPDLIGFDNARAYGTPSYYTQKLLAVHRGDRVLDGELEQPDEYLEALGSIDQGGIGLATDRTAAEFKDVRVTDGDKVLLESAFDKDSAGWQPSRGAQWATRDGAYAQTDTGRNTTALAGDAAWTDYTVTLKARKTAGSNGFQVLFRAPNARSYYRLNVGDGGNKRTVIDRPIDRDGLILIAVAEPFTPIETGRWYDVKIEIKGLHVTCWLDGRQIIDVPDLLHYGDLPGVMHRIDANALRDDKSGDIVIKVVNWSDTSEQLRVVLNGAGKIQPRGEAIVLTSASQEDENSLDEPTKVAPVTRAIDGLSGDFTRTFEPLSLTILRLKTR